MGGTFDIIHTGHIELLKKSFEMGKFVIIGLSSDTLVKEKLKKNINNSFEVRKRNLVDIIDSEVGSTEEQITKSWGWFWTINVLRNSWLYGSE